MELKDKAGNTDSFQDQITLDLDLPTGSLLINDGDEFSTSRDITLSLTQADEGSGADQMRFKVNDGAWSDWEDIASQKDLSLDDLDGEQTVSYEIRDQVDRISETLEETITLDRSLPTGSILINDGDEFATSRDITLTLTGDDQTSGIGEMRFSQDGGTTWTDWEAFATTKDLSLEGADGEKTVTVELKDQAGNTDSFQDQITLDLDLPTGSISINDNDEFSTSRDITLSLTQADEGSGADQMRFKVNDGDWSDWEEVASEKEITLDDEDGEQTVSYEIRDQVDRISETLEETITLDRSLPTGSILINDGDEFATSRDITLTLTGDDETSGIGEMRFSQDGGTTWTDWEAFATTKDLSLEGEDGEKTVRMELKDKAGNTDSFQDQITLDLDLPTGSLLINDGDEFSTSRDITLSLTQSDEGSGADQMRFKVNDGAW